MLEKALRIAERSPLHRYRTGAVLLDPSGRQLATGWSHYGTVRYTQAITEHAEMHALRRAGRVPDGSAIFVATLARSGRIATARPCAVCARRLREAGVATVLYTTPEGVCEERIIDHEYHHRCRRPGDWIPALA